ncbi:MATH and LRR domain-containing protein PFE0570w-like [Cotesia glomerata]|uniref:Uncharacterized protein n=1 Tax=Cotesia glomerata TaxID=32391 RepID=A0AAV7I283_COTGL|nr:MATH and LRR domain-containing protein PFE0570w-like [Cotesia glomerata]KAH0541138.1 hypothetical protein KQX54_021129 [Cotesia glomerata]
MNDKRVRLEKFTPKNADSSSSSCSTSSFSEDETDDKPLKPIKDYLYNRREMSRQLFMSVKTEKIKMMLPQTLKKIDLSELEELCANELCGMSKSRVLSILNGKQMLDSSNTSESDDSGPSLEIISDTEAWITDSELPDEKDKVSASKSRKVKMKKIKKEPTASDKQAKTNSQNKNKSARKQTVALVKVKNEKESKSQPQQGESLLDLLELEMRARAIRALIRKEEDIIPNESTSKISANVNSLLDQANISLAVGLGNNSSKEADKSSARSKVEEAVSLSLNSNEDEDVVLVVKPTPTINLLSSDSEAEDSNVNISKSNGEKIETSTECYLTDKNNKEENQDKLSDSLNINKINQDNDVNNKSSGSTNSESKDKSQDSAITKVPSDNKSSELYKEKSKKINEPSKVLEESGNSIILHDEDEIIDLDNYSDDMDEIENDKIVSSSVKNNPSKVEVKFTVESNSTESSSLDSSETWATRYYQTDNVQSVIKESKIQSEIRKRLRERQKLSKLNNNSNNNGNSVSKESVIKSNAVEKPIEPDNSKPTGSVEEYLALKRVSSPDVKSTVCEQNPTDVKVDNIPGEKIFPVTTENIDQSAGDESTIEQPHVSPSIPVQENS